MAQAAGKPDKTPVVPLKGGARNAATSATSTARPGTAPASAAPATAEPPKKSRKRVILLVIATMFIVAGCIVAWLLLRAHTGTPAPAPEKPPIFVSLDPFTVNLQLETSDQYLQTALAIRVSDEPTAEVLKQYVPEIRNRLLLLLSSKHASELSSVAGKQALRADIAVEVQHSLPTALRSNVVGVFFTSFVVQ